MKVADEVDDVDVEVRPAPGSSGPGWARLVALAAALCFLAGVVGW